MRATKVTLENDIELTIGINHTDVDGATPLLSRSHTLYIGITRDLHKRVLQHKWKEDDGFTARYNCDRLVCFEGHDEVNKAIAREKQIKGWKRDRKIALIESTNSAWIDSSREWYDLEPADYCRVLDRTNS